MSAPIPEGNILQVQRPGREMDITDLQGIDEGTNMVKQHFFLEGRVKYHGRYHTQDENKSCGQIEPGLPDDCKVHADFYVSIFALPVEFPAASSATSSGANSSKRSIPELLSSDGCLLHCPVSLVEIVWRSSRPVTEWIGLLITVKGKKKHDLVDVGAEILPQHQQSLIGTSGK